MFSFARHKLLIARVNFPTHNFAVLTYLVAIFILNESMSQTMTIYLWVTLSIQVCVCGEGENHINVWLFSFNYPKYFTHHNRERVKIDL